MGCLLWQIRCNEREMIKRSKTKGMGYSYMLSGIKILGKHLIKKENLLLDINEW